MSEWVEFVEDWTQYHEPTYGLQPELARLLLKDCVKCKELTIYQAHQVYDRYMDNRGFS